MPLPRKALVSLEATPYYHCVSRCVRRAFLCGKDKQSGKDYEHRRAWIKERMQTLACVFAVDLCAYGALVGEHLLPPNHRRPACISDGNWGKNSVSCN